jgi:hypothetical protein
VTALEDALGKAKGQRLSKVLRLVHWCFEALEKIEKLENERVKKKLQMRLLLQTDTRGPEYLVLPGGLVEFRAYVSACILPDVGRSEGYAARRTCREGRFEG